MLRRIYSWVRDLWSDIKQRLIFEFIMGDIEWIVQTKLVNRYKNQLLYQHQKDDIIHKAIDICRAELMFEFRDAIIDPNEWYDDHIWRGFYIDICYDRMYHRVYLNLLDIY